MYELDQDTIVEQVGPGLFAGELTDRWNIGAVANGGYVLAFALAAVRKTLSAPDPLTVTAHYLRASVAGPVRVEVETIKIGRQYSTASARLVQNDKENVRLLATYGDLGAQSGPVHVFGTAPILPARETPVAAPPADAP